MFLRKLSFFTNLSQYVNWALFRSEHILPSVGILSLSFLIIAPFIRPLLAMGERVLDYMWLAISYVSLAGLIKGWLDGLSGLSGASCIFQVFFWAGLVLIIIYAVHIVRSSWKKGRRLKSTQ